MSTAYWLSFALAIIPHCGYLVGMTLTGLAAGRVNRPVPRGRRLSSWLLMLFGLAAFGFAGWQQVSLEFFFDPLPPYTDGDFEAIESREVVGVTVPVEIGSAAFDVVSSAFSMLITGTFAVFCLAMVFFPKPRGLLPPWGQNILLVIIMGFFVWTSWSSASSVMRD